MTINADGSSKLTNAFQKAIDDAQAEADRLAAAIAAQKTHGPRCSKNYMGHV